MPSLVLDEPKKDPRLELDEPADPRFGSGLYSEFPDLPDFELSDEHKQRMSNSLYYTSQYNIPPELAYDMEPELTKERKELDLLSDMEKAIKETPENIKIGTVGLAASTMFAIKRRGMMLSGGGIFPDEMVKHQFEPIKPEKREKLADWRERPRLEIPGMIRPTTKDWPTGTLAEAFGLITRLPSAVGTALQEKQRKLAEKQDRLILTDAPITKAMRKVTQSGTPSMAAAVGVALLTGDPIVALALLGEMEGGGAFQTQLEGGASIMKANVIGDLSEAAEIGGEMMVLPKVFKGVKEGFSLKEAFTTILENTVQEGITGFNQRFLEVFGLETTKGTEPQEAALKALNEGIDAIPENAWVGGASAGGAVVVRGGFDLVVAAKGAATKPAITEKPIAKPKEAPTEPVAAPTAAAKPLKEAKPPITPEAPKAEEGGVPLFVDTPVSPQEGTGKSMALMTPEQRLKVPPEQQAKQLIQGEQTQGKTARSPRTAEENEVARIANQFGMTTVFFDKSGGGVELGSTPSFPNVITVETGTEAKYEDYGDRLVRSAWHEASHALRHTNPDIRQQIDKVIKEHSEGQRLISESRKRFQEADPEDFQRQLDLHKEEGPTEEAMAGIIADAMVGKENIPADLTKTIKGLLTPTPQAKAKPVEKKAEPKKAKEKKAKEPERKVSRLAERAEELAVEKQLVENLGELPTFERMKMADQAKRATKIIEEDYDKAKNIALGKESPPSGLRAASVYEAVKYKAVKEGDVETLRQIATESTIPTELSALGQEIKAADTRTAMADPVKAMQDIKKIKEVAVKKRMKIKSIKRTTSRMTKEMKSVIRETTTRRQNWNEFVESIRC